MNPDETSSPVMVPVPEPDLTPADMIARAVDRRQLLRENQADTEKRGRPSQAINDEMVKDGFFRMLQPRRFGGYEADLTSFFEAMIELARGCPSTGWLVTVASGHPQMVAKSFREDAQAEIFGEDGHFVAPLSGQAVDASIKRVDGGYIIDGKWGFASGIPYATHFMGSIFGGGSPEPDGTAERAAGPPPGFVFVVPKGEYTMLEDWGDLIGLRGSGSNSAVLDNVFVPEHLVAPFSVADEVGASGNIGYEIHGNPRYAVPFLPFATLELVVVQVGIGRAALDEFEEIITKSRMFLGQKVPARFETRDYQRIYGLSLANVDAAQSIVLRNAKVLEDSLAEAVEGGAPFTTEAQLRVYGEALTAARLVWEAGEMLFRASSSTAARDGQRMQRYWRDLCAFRSNGIHQLDFRAPAVAHAHFGLPIEFM